MGVRSRAMLARRGVSRRPCAREGRGGLPSLGPASPHTQVRTRVVRVLCDSSCSIGSCAPLAHKKFWTPNGFSGRGAMLGYFFCFDPWPNRRSPPFVFERCLKLASSLASDARQSTSQPSRGARTCIRGDAGRVLKTCSRMHRLASCRHRAASCGVVSVDFWALGLWGGALERANLWSRFRIRTWAFLPLGFRGRTSPTD